MPRADRQCQVMGEENDREESDEGRRKSRLWSLIDLGGGNSTIVENVNAASDAFRSYIHW